MTVNCVWEHNGNDTLLYAVDYIGAFTRGENLAIAKEKMKNEIRSYFKWAGFITPETVNVAIVQEKTSTLAIKDGDSDVLFDAENEPLTETEYKSLKALVLKSAKDFLELYDCIPNKEIGFAPARKTFYGQVPRTATEMYAHTKNVNSYYFNEIGVDTQNDGSIYDCRLLGFQTLEKQPNFLQKSPVEGSWGEFWSLRKVLRRFIWHDRIHAKAMWKLATKLFGEENIKDPFYFKKLFDR